MLLTKMLLRPSNLFPDKTGFIDVDRDKVFTYKELAIRAEKVKHVLLAKGVSKGDRVALLLFNQSTYLEIVFGATAMGACVVPINTRLTINELSYILNDSGAETVFIGSEFLDKLPELKVKVKCLRNFIIVPEKQKGIEEFENAPCYEHLLDGQKEEELKIESGVVEDDLAVLLYTSGTTGRPKGVMHTHKSLFYNVLNIIVFLQPREEDIHLHTAPMFHTGGMTNLLNKTLVGATHVSLKAFDAKRVLEVVDRVKITSVFLVPTMLNRFLNDPEFEKYDTSSLRLLIYGAAPMPVNLLRLAKEKIPNLTFGQGYGATETASAVIMLRADQHKIFGSEKEQRRLQSCGQPSAGMDVKIIGTDGEEVPQGEVGQIIIKGPMVMKGYWNSPEETSKALRDGWYYTGDVAYRDEENFYYIVDRAKDMIISGGENIFSIEIEEVLYQHPAISECAVIGVPDDLWGEAVKAIVVKKPGYSLTEKEVIQFVREQLAGYKVPKSVEFIEELPKSNYGKILKYELRKKYWKDRNKSVN